MANASLEPIYNRLNGVQRYHPFSAKTFTDWASEAGDTVQISREGTVYTAPVHKQSLVWRGKHMINMQSTGTRERTPIERMSNQKENETSAGMSSSRGYGGGAGKAIKALQYDFYDEDGIYHSQLYMDEQRFTTIFTKTGIDGLPEGTSLMTRINQNANEISLEAIRAQGAETNLSGRITVEAGKIQQIVSAVGANGQVTAASIVLAINESTGQSEAKIDADHVYIGNSKSTTVIAGKLNTSDLWAKIADLASVTMLAAQVTGNTVCHGALSVGTSLAVNQSYGITAAGTGNFSGIKLGSYSSFSDCVTDASVANNVLTLTKASGGTVTFSKATALSPVWRSGTFTVSASPQGNTVTTGLFSVAAADISWDDNVATFTVYANIDGGETRYSTGKTLSIDASDIYDDGAASVTLSEGSWSDGAKTITASNGKTVTVSIPASSSSSWTNTSGDIWRVGIVVGGATRYSDTKDFSSIRTAGYTAGYSAGYKMGWNDLCDELGATGTGEYTRYSGTWYGVLYVAPTGGATPVNNCVGQAKSYKFSRKT